jgi:hypothetical protein
MNLDSLPSFGLTPARVKQWAIAAYEFDVGVYESSGNFPASSTSLRDLVPLLFGSIYRLVGSTDWLGSWLATSGYASLNLPVSDVAI